MYTYDKAQYIQYKLYLIRPCGETFKVTAEDVMNKATPEEIDFFYDKLSAIERETLTNTIKNDRI